MKAFLGLIKVIFCFLYYSLLFSIIHFRGSYQMLWFYRYELFKNLLELSALSKTVHAVVNTCNFSKAKSFVAVKDCLKSVKNFVTNYC